MPTKRGQRRVERCAFIEGGVRCRRSGTGEPCLCNPHRIALTDAGRQPAAFGEGVKNLVDRFVNGRRVTRKVWEGAIGDLVGAWQATQQAPQQQQQHASGGGGFQPPPGVHIPPQWRDFLRDQARRARQAPQPPPIDPAIEQNRKARITLGFTPGQALTLDMIQKRRRELARKHHPDRGGSVGKMQEVNAAADVLEASISAR